jgi:hypothetical protein
LEINTESRKKMTNDEIERIQRSIKDILPRLILIEDFVEEAKESPKCPSRLRELGGQIYNTINLCYEAQGQLNKLHAKARHES